jgi:uroporphyrinogen decarboxylase
MSVANLSHKERLRRALCHESIDHLPTQINFTAEMGAKMAAHFNVSGPELPRLLDNHLVRVDLSCPNRYSEDRVIRFDWWGVGFDTREEGYFICSSPLSASKDLDAFHWPDPDQVHLFEEARQVIQNYGQEYFVAPNLGFALFERAWSLRGLEQFLVDLALDGGFTEELLEHITEIQLVLIRRYLDLGVDAGYFGDDYGAQNGLLISPIAWRRHFKPRLARMFAPFRERGLPVILHSDGQIQKIIPDLIEIGMTVLNPVQPEVLEHTWLGNSFRGKLAFYGGISTQTVLPAGSPEQVRQAVRDCQKRLAPHTTGMLLAPSHRMMKDIPLINVEAMLDTFNELKFSDQA